MVTMTHPTLYLSLVTTFLALSHATLTFPTWKSQYNKTYSSVAEEFRRFTIFQDTKAFVEQHNKNQKNSMTLGLGQYADLTDEEFYQLSGMSDGNEDIDTLYNTSVLTHELECEDYLGAEQYMVPGKKDWTKEKEPGPVTAVKNQLEPKCCKCTRGDYAYSTVGAIEGQRWKQTCKKRCSKVAFSEQQIMDCSYDHGNRGCRWGTVVNSYNYVKKNRGIATRVNYPYRDGKVGPCDKEVKLGPKVTGCKRIPGDREDLLMQMVGTLGPVSAAIDARHRTFKNYKGGVYHEPACNKYRATFFVLIVGYGRQNGVDYWKVKNSWGTGWGEDGYIKIRRNKNNHCGIASMATIPVLQNKS